jgi:hypothetical protein
MFQAFPYTRVRKFKVSFVIILLVWYHDTAVGRSCGNLPQRQTDGLNFLSTSANQTVSQAHIYTLAARGAASQ